MKTSWKWFCGVAVAIILCCTENTKAGKISKPPFKPQGEIFPRANDRNSSLNFVDGNAEAQMSKDKWYHTNEEIEAVPFAGERVKGRPKAKGRWEDQAAPPDAMSGLMTGHPHGKPKIPIFCYYGSSASGRPSVGKFFPEHIDPFLCTHVIFAFVDITEDGTGIKPNNWNDLGENGLYTRTIKLKERNPDLKILLAVGGWKIGSKPFLPVIESRDTWTVWIANVISYLREKGFDGFDMDWEFPGIRGSGEGDKHKFTLMMKDLHDTFAEEAERTGRDRLLLTLATAASVFYVEKAYETTEIHKHIDYLLLMTYNYHGSGWEKETGHASPLMPHPLDPEGEQRENFVLWSIQYWLQQGVPKEKLVMGMVTYGLGWKLTDPTNTGVHAPADGGNTKGKYTGESGILAHYEICEHVIEDDWDVRWIESQRVPYAFGDGEWVGFESPDSFYIKAATILREGLGGAFVWSVEMDDFNGYCGGPKYPLIRTIYEIFTHASTRPANLEEAPAAASHSASASSYQQHQHAQDVPSASASRVSEEEHPSSSSSLDSSAEYSHDVAYYENNDENYSSDMVDCDSLGLGIHPDPWSCAHFILCIPRSRNVLSPSRMTCPAGTLFDNSLKVCNHEHEVSCMK